MSSRAAWAIYLLDPRTPRCVLLTDGAWTAPANTGPRSRLPGEPSHRPRLFLTRREAREYMLGVFGMHPHRYQVDKWEGAS